MPSGGAAGAVLALWMVEGFGTETPGGLGGETVHVTTLADGGPGSLRQALDGDNRTVVFDVGGTIELASALDLRGREFVSVDGGSAPAPGITLHGDALVIRGSHDIVVTHLRIRESGGDNLLVWDGSSNVVIDHCSVSNGGDENISITEDTSDVTLSWTILGDTRDNSFALATKGSLVANFNAPAVTRVSIHHNLYTNFHQRSPQISSAGVFDVRNNAILQWGSYGVRVRNGSEGNFVGNVLVSDTNPDSALVITDEAGAWFTDGNNGPDDLDGLGTAVQEFEVAPVTTHDAAEVEALVRGCAGAMPRDAIDALLVGPPSDACTGEGGDDDGGDGSDGGDGNESGSTGFGGAGDDDGTSADTSDGANTTMTASTGSSDSDAGQGEAGHRSDSDRGCGCRSAPAPALAVITYPLFLRRRPHRARVSGMSLARHPHRRQRAGPPPTLSRGAAYSPQPRASSAASSANPAGFGGPSLV